MPQISPPVDSQAINVTRIAKYTIVFLKDLRLLKHFLRKFMEHMIIIKLTFTKKKKIYLGAILIPPSRRIVSPFKKGFSIICAVKRANSSGSPKRLGN